MQERINADFRRAASARLEELPWEPAPAAGVWRRKLERLAAESGWTTSVVRYEANGRFPAHRHPAGEEFLVLSGTFHDEHGAYPVGTFVRNPPGSGHAPFTEEGCTLLVKLCQYAEGDTEHAVRTAPIQPIADGEHETSETVLHRHGAAGTRILRLPAGALLTERVANNGREWLVLAGDIASTRTCLAAGHWSRVPRTTATRWTVGTAGCVLFERRGHRPHTA